MYNVKKMVGAGREAMRMNEELKFTLEGFMYLSNYSEDRAQLAYNAFLLGVAVSQKSKKVKNDI